MSVPLDAVHRSACPAVSRNHVPVRSWSEANSMSWNVFRINDDFEIYNGWNAETGASVHQSFSFSSNTLHLKVVETFGGGSLNFWLFIESFGRRSITVAGITHTYPIINIEAAGRVEHIPRSVRVIAPLVGICSVIGGPLNSGSLWRGRLRPLGCRQASWLRYFQQSPNARYGCFGVALVLPFFDDWDELTSFSL